MGGGEAPSWLAASGAKKGSARGRRQGATGGFHTGSCYWASTNCSRVLRKKASIGALGVAGVREVVGQPKIVLRLLRAPRGLIHHGSRLF